MKHKIAQENNGLDRMSELMMKDCNNLAVIFRKDNYEICHLNFFVKITS